MRKILEKLFILCAGLSILLAGAYVVVQILAIFRLSGGLAVWAEEYLEIPVCVMCSAAAILAYIMSYTSKWTESD